MCIVLLKRKKNILHSRTAPFHLKEEIEFFFFFLRNKHTQGKRKNVLTQKHTTTPHSKAMIIELNIEKRILKRHSLKNGLKNKESQTQVH